MQSRHRFFPPPVYDAIVLLTAAYLSHHKLIACWIDPSCMAAGAIADYSLWGMIVIVVLLFLAREGKNGPYWEAWRSMSSIFYPFLALFLLHHVRGFPPDNPKVLTFYPVQDNSLVIERWAVPTPQGDKPDKPLFIDILDHKPDFIHVRSEHYFEFIAAFYCDQITQGIFLYLVNMPS